MPAPRPIQAREDADVQDFDRACVVLVLSVSAVLAPCVREKGTGYFRDRARGFSVVFPEDWEIKTEGFSGHGGTGLEPLEEKGDPFRENVNISVEDLPKDVGLQYYREMTFDNIAKALTNSAKPSATSSGWTGARPS